MLTRGDSHPVRYYSIVRRLAGRELIRTGIFRVDDLLVDTGSVRGRGVVQQVLAEDRPAQVVLTHHHEDHVGNAALAAAAAGIEGTPWIHPLGLPLVAMTVDLPLYRRVAWGVPEPVAARPLGEWLETEHHRFRVLHTPGHAADHVALHEPSQGWLFVGDLYLGDRVRLGFAYENTSEIISSLRRLLAIPDCEMFCQHTGRHDSHQHRLGRKLDFLLGLQRRAVMHFEEGRSLGDITRELGLQERFYRLVSRGEWCGRNLVRGLLRDAGKLD